MRVAAVSFCLTFLLCLLVTSSSGETLNDFFGDYYYMTLFYGHNEIAFYAQSLDSNNKLKGFRLQATVDGYFVDLSFQNLLAAKITTVNYDTRVCLFVCLLTV